MPPSPNRQYLLIMEEKEEEKQEGKKEAEEEKGGAEGGRCWRDILTAECPGQSLQLSVLPASVLF